MAKAAEQPKFKKAQILRAKKYSTRIDLVNALLDDNMEYTIDDVDKKIDDFLKGAVK